MTSLLVAGTSHIRQKLRSGMRHVSTIQNRQKPNKTTLFPHRSGNINQTLCLLLYGLNHRPSTSGQTRFHLGRGRPRPFEGGNFNTLQQDSHIGRHGMTIIRKSIQAIWTPRQDHFRLRPSIRIKSIHRTSKIARNQISTVNCLSPSDGRNYRKSHSGNRSIPVNILHLPS